MGHLWYRIRTILKNLRSGIKFHRSIPAELCGDCQKGDQTHPSSKSHMTQVNEFLGRVNSDLEGFFSLTRQGYWYYIPFLEESKGFIDIEPLKFKEDALVAFKNNKALNEKESGCQLKIFHTDRGGEYIGRFKDCLKENCISHEITAPYSL